MREDGEAGNQSLHLRPVTPWRAQVVTEDNAVADLCVNVTEDLASNPIPDRVKHFKCDFDNSSLYPEDCRIMFETESDFKKHVEEVHTYCQRCRGPQTHYGDKLNCSCFDTHLCCDCESL